MPKTVPPHGDPAPAPTPVSARPGKRMQMADIARLAGVSSATVSRALSGSPLINEETRKRITEIARSMNYQVNVGAANLRKRDVKTVGVVILGDSLQLISDPFILGLIGHIADALDERGMSLLLSRLNRARNDNLAAMVESGQVAGLLVIGQLDCHEHLNELARRGIPMVVWGAHLPDRLYPLVGGDNSRGGYLATQHMLAQGCKHIAFLGDIAHPEVRLRHDGYVRALHDAGLKPNPQLYKPFLFASNAVRQTIGEWVDEGIVFDGVLATSDVAAISIISALKERELRVPQDVKVVGYDDISMAAHMHPSLSSVRQPTQLAGKAMVQLLLETLDDRPSDPIMLPAELIVRESSST